LTAVLPLGRNYSFTFNASLMSLDSIDIAILKILQKNALAKIKDISAQVNLSMSPTHDRIKRLELEGYIQGYVGILDRKKIDLGLIVHCHVTLDKQTTNNFSEFEQIISQYPEVISCSLVSGNFDYFLKLVTKDVESYNKFYQEKLAVLPMVAHINSLFVMDEIKTTTELPL
jgi:Lrp/AsnC family transcriptional regulator, leucine-responsive regulatory protein